MDENLNEKENADTNQAINSEEVAEEEKTPEKEEEKTLGEEDAPEDDETTEVDKAPESEETTATDKNPVKEKKKHGKVWIPIIIIGLAICGLGITYIVKANYYRNRFFPGTVINGVDYSNEFKEAVMEDLRAEMQGYRLEVKGRDVTTGGETVLTTLLAADVELGTSLGEADVEKILEEQDEWKWPEILWKNEFNYTLKGEVIFNEDKLETFLGSQPAFQLVNMQTPEDAYIKGYSEEEACFVLEPEIKGTQLDIGAVTGVVRDAIGNEQQVIDLEEQGLYAEPAVTTENAELQQRIQEANKWLSTRITYDWNANEVVLDGEILKEWIAIEDGRAVLDEEAVAAFVKENAKKFDTFKKNHKFTTYRGVELTLPCGDFGWRTNRDEETAALIELIKEGTVGNREPIYSSTAPAKGENDIGNSYVEADLSHQHLYLYVDGEIVLETDFVSGNIGKGYVTPAGVYGLTYKTTNAVLRGRDYATPVNYWMPFHGNYGMHDATWRSEFGGNIFLTNGSHGCLNLPLGKAAEIYSHVSKGFPVICYYYSSETLNAMNQQENPGEENVQGDLSQVDVTQVENPPEDYIQMEEPQEVQSENN